jgi:hypothetical protein
MDKAAVFTTKEAETDQEKPEYFQSDTKIAA